MYVCSVATYQIAWCYNLEHHHVNAQHREDFKSHLIFT
jgi:hypothetical protein